MDKRIGAQLYTVRDYAKTIEDFEETLKKLSQIGYQAVQLSGIGPFEAKDIKRLCERYNMIPVCTHRGMDEYCEHLEESVQFHKELGCKYAGLGAIPGSWKELTKEGLAEFVEKVNAISRVFKENGMSFTYHNHYMEFMKWDGKYVMDYFIENGEFDFIVDVYWLAYAGIDPARFITRLGSRAKIIHFKDMKIVCDEKAHQMAEVMEGNLDWDSIIEASEKAGAEWAMVEQDICQGDPFESLKISYDNLKTKGFC